MKINWGTGIVLAFIGFIAFILYFVVRMSMDGQSDHELVTSEYYKRELAYQNEIDAEKATARLNAQLEIKKTEEGLFIGFPKDFEPQKITGTVSLYRPSNRHLDFDLPLRLSNPHLLIPDNRLLDGRWDITVQWQYNGETLLFKKRLNY